MEWAQLGQIGISFVFVIGLMLGLAYLVRRFGLEKRWAPLKSAEGLLHVEDTMFLDPKRRVVVLGMQRKRYVLLLDNERAQIIDTLEQSS